MSVSECGCVGLIWHTCSCEECLPIHQKNMMLVGIDIYHDSVHGKSRSITGFVASTNP